MTYGDTKGHYFGSHSQYEDVCNIMEGKNITMVRGSEGLKSRDATWIQRIEFRTTDGEVCGPYGGEIGTEWTSSFSGCYLYYISGTDLNGSLSSLTFHWKCSDAAIKSVGLG